jgi:hypothetical protein
MNAWNTLLESYQQRVYNTLATVKRQIRQAVNPTPAMVISVEVARIGHGILFDCLTSELALEEPAIASNDPNIPTDDNCMDVKLHSEMPGYNRDCNNEGDLSGERYTVPTASR